MILYFSATGNTRFVAEELGRLLGDESQDLCPRIRQQDYSPICSEKPLVLCAPTYVSEAPGFFMDYMRKAKFTGNRKVYFISTSGGYSGISGKIAGHILRQKGMEYMGCTEFKMPPNYIANKPHRLPETEEIIRRIRDAQEKVVPVAKTIKAGRPLKSRHVWLLEWLIEYPLNPILGYFGHRIEGFSVEGTCVSCGVCEEVCPVNAIRMQEGKPVWKGKTCAHCMACIQNCPEESIEYKDITQGRKRYRLEDYRGLLQDEKIERTENMEA